MLLLSHSDPVRITAKGGSVSKSLHYYTIKVFSKSAILYQQDGRPNVQMFDLQHYDLG